jgi:hypothetical protein
MKLRSHCLYSGIAFLFVFSAISCLEVSDDKDGPKPKPGLLKPHLVIGQSWSGEVAIELRKEIPQKGYISDQESWAKVWKAYRGEEKLPNIDFDNEIVLVVAGSDPNRISINTQLKENGDLKVTYMSTLIGFHHPTKAAYHLMQISRTGIKTINGKPIE